MPDKMLKFLESEQLREADFESSGTLLREIRHALENPPKSEEQKKVLGFLVGRLFPQLKRSDFKDVQYAGFGAKGVEVEGMVFGDNAFHGANNVTAKNCIFGYMAFENSRRIKASNCDFGSDAFRKAKYLCISDCGFNDFGNFYDADYVVAIARYIKGLNNPGPDGVYIARTLDEYVERSKWAKVFYARCGDRTFDKVRVITLGDLDWKGEPVQQAEAVFKKYNVKTPEWFGKMSF